MIQGILKLVRTTTPDRSDGAVTGVMFETPVVGKGVSVTHVKADKLFCTHTSPVTALKVVDGVGIVFRTRNSYYTFTFTEA